MNLAQFIREILGTTQDHGSATTAVLAALAASYAAGKASRKKGRTLQLVDVRYFKEFITAGPVPATLYADEFAFEAMMQAAAATGRGVFRVRRMEVLQ